MTSHLSVIITEGNVSVLEYVMKYMRKKENLEYEPSFGFSVVKSGKKCLNNVKVFIISVFTRLFSLHSTKMV